jgi:hypothetical protein
MSERPTGGCTRVAIPDASGHAAALGLADWLCLAAAPTFAIMALLTAVLSGGAPAMICSGMQDGSPLSGMAVMYALMSAFHSAPWLKLIFGTRGGPA